MYTWAELRGKETQDLVEIHDKQTQNVEESILFIREELRHREIRGGTNAVLRYTREMTWMTLVIAVATIINVVLWAVDKLCR